MNLRLKSYISDKHISLCQDTQWLDLIVQSQPMLFHFCVPGYFATNHLISDF